VTFAEDTRAIPLTRGLVAIVDAADYDWLSAFKWHALACKGGQFYYASRRLRMGELGWIEKTFTLVLMHRQILNAQRGTLVDHRDHNGLNNVRDNLRVATASQNGANTEYARGRTSGFYGVSWSAECSKWRSRICVDRSSIYLGVFASEREAALARDEAARRYFGDFARLNFP